eukprot:TRINITY_DN3242_c0_g1_i1.p1 TRINITY_DN3242_c0_g1~~TRINITY_DN3242_c0_g1_i1.p1  ORF type:complete len:264 (-),score=58.39 TRINITY_DN3242_c0_g1_i1:151-942(-)
MADFYSTSEEPHNNYPNSYAAPAPTQTSSASNAVSGKVKEWLVEGMTQEDRQQTTPQLNEKKNYRFWDVEYYQDYFDVDTKDVALRMFKSAIPFPPSFFEIIRDKPDAWGPFWITTTLVVLLACAGNFANYLKAYQEDKHDGWSFDYIKLPVAAGVIWGLAVIFPVIAWLYLRSLPNPHTFLQMFCIYGYSFTIFIPCAVVAIIPFTAAKWVAGIAAALISGFFLILHFFFDLKEEKVRCLVVILVVGVIQAALALIFALYFF